MRRKNLVAKTILILLMILIILLIVGLIITYYQNKNKDSAVETREISENGTSQLCFSMQENCTAKILPLLQNAQEIHAATYDLDEPAVLGILREKKADVLVDEDNYAGFGKKIVKPGLMHDKFFVVYNSSGKDYVITGSTNPTKNDFYRNDNNMIIIDSGYLVKNYESEFQEIKKGLPDSKTKYTRILFNGTLIENYFCPDDGCEAHVADEIQRAKREIYFMTFSFTSDRIGNAIIAKKGMLGIKGVFDASQVASNKEYSEYPKMKKAGLDVKIEDSAGKLHHKVFIIDNETVVTGSYNPTESGDARNDENILILHDKTIAQEYLKEFERIWAAN